MAIASTVLATINISTLLKGPQIHSLIMASMIEIYVKNNSRNQLIQILLHLRDILV